jgi:hypothetical protein
MRRLLSSLFACWSYTSPVGGGLLPSAPAAFSASLSSCPIVGLGRCQCFAPARFLEVNQDDNHSWFGNRDRD